jgi:hypothetical protein
LTHWVHNNITDRDTLSSITLQTFASGLDSEERELEPTAIQRGCRFLFGKAS